MSTPTTKTRARLLWEQLDREASDARDRASQHRQVELAALRDDDDAAAEAPRAMEYVERGKAFAYEDAALRVKVLAAGIPEET